MRQEAGVPTDESTPERERGAIERPAGARLSDGSPSAVRAEAPRASAPPIPAFSLALANERLLPTALQSAADGLAYPVDPDFRTVLACLRRLEDPDRSELEKRLYVAKRFFLARPPRDMEALFLAFVTGGETADADEPPLIDFERDAGAIYASFRQQYGIDLLRTSLHWAEFRELLAGLGEATPLGVRARLRALDESRLPPEERARVRRLRDRIALTPRVGLREQALTAELDRRLAAGEDPAEILKQLQEV